MSATSDPPFSTNTICASISVSVGSVDTSFPSSSTKWATFEIGPVNPSISVTSTWKLIVTSPGVDSSVLAGTLTSIPFAKSASVLLVKSTVSPFIT